jgi:dTDP-glucose pyrophosphorylase
MSDTVLKFSDTLYDAVKVIENTYKRLAVVVDSENVLLGTLTDGDIRRCLLNGGSLQTEVGEAMNTSPVVTLPNTASTTMVRQLQDNVIQSIPIVDDQGRFCRIVHISELIGDTDSAPDQDLFSAAVIMAGGEGTRLRPLTENMPKPMVKIGGAPLLERLIKKMAKSGLKKIYISVNYLSDVIESHFADGKRFGIEILYLKEKHKLGTAGALSLLPNTIDGPLLVMNGDVFSTYDLNNRYSFHCETNAKITVGAVEYRVEIPYGVIKSDGSDVVGLEEKPSQRYLCNAGIYVLSPEVLKLIPEDIFFNMTDLIDSCLKMKQRVTVFPVHEYWTDIGTPEDLEKARKLFSKLAEAHEH